MKWCPWRESDPRPPPYQGGALPLSHMGIDTGLESGPGAQSCGDKLEKITNTEPKHITLERETGIEPVSLAWKAKVLPLNYSRLAPPGLTAPGLPVALTARCGIYCLNTFAVVEEAGFEPA
jgi:hypothetical protein